MKAIILVGGEGTRLRPLTCQTPKAMVPVLNRPFLEHVVERLRQHCVDTIILTLCYLPEPIQSYFGDGSRFGVKMVYIEEKLPLGTAGAIKNAEVYFDDGPFFVLNGDIFSDLDYSGMMEAYRRSGAVASIALRSVEDVSMFGVVETLAGGRIKRFVEKPKAGEVDTNMINAGTYILDPRLLNYIPAGINVSIERNFFPLVLGKGEPLYAVPTFGYWIDIGKPEKYLELNRWLLTRTSGSGSRSTAGVKVGKETWVDSRARIKGPVLIGDGCKIEADAVITGPAVIGDFCRIGAGAKLDKVVLWSGVTVGKNSILDNCIVASNCVVHDNCCVGEGCVVGDNCTVTPDCIIKPGSKVWPGTLIQ